MSWNLVLEKSEQGRRLGCDEDKARFFSLAHTLLGEKRNDAKERILRKLHVLGKSFGASLDSSCDSGV